MFSNDNINVSLIGADPSKKDSLGFSPIIHAAQFGSVFSFHHLVSNAQVLIPRFSLHVIDILSRLILMMWIMTDTLFYVGRVTVDTKNFWSI